MTLVISHQCSQPSAGCEQKRFTTQIAEHTERTEIYVFLRDRCVLCREFLSISESFLALQKKQNSRRAVGATAVC
jgi:hypothetical protein